MGIPILGRKTPEKLARLNQEAAIQFHQEMRIELLRWEIENECMVGNQLITENTEAKMSFEAVFFIKKASPEQVNAMKKSLEKFQEELNKK